MNLIWLKSRWVKWTGFVLVLLAVAVLAAGATFWFISPPRMARSSHPTGLMNRPDLGDLRASFEQLRQLQAEMDQMVASDFEMPEAIESVHPQHPAQMLAQMEHVFRQMNLANQPVDPAGTFDEGWNVLAISPSINMHPEKDRLILTVTLPQTDKKDITLTLNGDVLKISAERHVQAISNTAQTRHHASSRFEQQIRLPATPTTPEAIEATFEDHVLKVIIPLPGLNPPQETKVPIR